MQVSPYTKISGLFSRNLMSSGFVDNLSLIFPPPFHQQTLKKNGLSDCTGDRLILELILLIRELQIDLKLVRLILRSTPV